MTTIRRARLPNGLEVWAPNRLEATVLYREIFTERTYEQHGVRIREGAAVFDVGANIGLFGIHLARTVPGVRVYAFEPIPELFDALTRNLAEHLPTAHTRNVGLADREGDAVFEVDRFLTITATMHPDVMNDRAARDRPAAAWASAALADLEKVAPGRRWMRIARTGLGRPMTRVGVLAVLAPCAAALALRRRIFLRRPRCRLQTLSAALAESQLDEVDLVKIDVEGAEEHVLAGIAEHDWPRLRQLVIEVHDVDGRLNRLTEMLEARGYRTVHARADWALHELLGISTLYAMRS